MLNDGRIPPWQRLRKNKTALTININNKTGNMKQIAILMIALITTLGINAQDKTQSYTTSTTTKVYIAKD